jgi:GNAT superfamily N-acetyltransferase
MMNHCQGDVNEYLSSLGEVPEVLEMDRRAHQRAARRVRVASRPVGAVTIRHATLADIPPMVEMGLHFLRQSPYKTKLAENGEQMAKLGERLISHVGGILVAEGHGNILGMLGYVIHEHFISGEKMVGEVFWWVEPEQRGAGLKLLDELERVAKDAGAVKLHMIAPDERLGKLYERFGYEFLETTFQKTL